MGLRIGARRMIEERKGELYRKKGWGGREGDRFCVRERGREREKRKLCSCVAAWCVSIVILVILRLSVIIHERKRI